MTDAAENSTVATRITEAIAERIIAGTLKPDMPLRQDHIAREFNSSHVPVREAFRQLEAQHLVVALPRRGVRVAPLDATAIREISEMRAALEVVALRHAAPRLTQAHLAKIELALIEGENAETLQDFEAANRAFHKALVAPCGMPRLLASLDGLQRANSRLVFAMARSSGWRPRSNQDHRLILGALRARNIEQASALLARHIQTIERLVSQF
ncbi:GntR family transcriptional regulator [Bradyrhizobium sp.]|jgi:DNA-binding GntR family transcriptional regulator|uniref:GntR family transcriptional regulator n=1 Tax=Bradyrhizobium sp. TaxID=376 RepID=UPI002D56EA22|nr:GntR family transcriptional regulator [Bradyrhizobium sp.]HZR75687.1 GntR family transcriptional regulator [Bradyrhizobium sp.]